jgi:hypothetical protein
MPRKARLSRWTTCDGASHAYKRRQYLGGCFSAISFLEINMLYLYKGEFVAFSDALRGDMDAILACAQRVPPETVAINPLLWENNADLVLETLAGGLEEGTMAPAVSLLLFVMPLQGLLFLRL